MNGCDCFSWSIVVTVTGGNEPVLYIGLVVTASGLSFRLMP